MLADSEGNDATVSELAALKSMFSFGRDKPGGIGKRRRSDSWADVGGLQFLANRNFRRCHIFHPQESVLHRAQNRRAVGNAVDAGW